MAAILFAVSNGTQEWLHQKTFMETLKRYNYAVFSGKGIQQDDVIVWRILKKARLYKDWEHLMPVKY